MAVLFVVNRSSGRGRAERLARRFAAAFEAAGEPFEVSDARAPAPGGMAREEHFRGFDAVAAVGGDGTLHHLLGPACHAGVPVYHIPAGNENLFARQFGMTDDPHRLLRALERGCVVAVDVPSLGGRPFSIMVSMGPDAGVIHRLDEVRSRASGHAMYLRPVLREVIRPRLARVSVRVDGRNLVNDETGLLIVANSPQYAARLDPVHEADMADGLLDALFLPAGTTLGSVLWGVRCAAGRATDSDRAVHARGREIEVAAHDRTPVQADGEAAGWLEAGQTARLTVAPSALRVLDAR